MRLLSSATALAAGLVFAAALSASASVSAPVLVSGPSPYAGCASSDAGQPGHEYLNGEEEPYVAVDPVNAAKMIGMFHQDRWSNGGAHGIAGAYSTSGGASWTEVTLPFSACAPGGLPYQRASDPWVSFGPDGTAYASALSFDRSDGRNAVSATVSRDGGATWTDTQTIVAFPNSQTGTDKNSTTADPVHAGVAYTVWDNLPSPTDQPDDRIHAAAFSGPAEFSKTTDGGRSWSTARTIIPTGNRHQTIGNIIVVDPRTDVLYDFTDLIVSPNTPKQGVRSNEFVAFVKSADGGATWTAQHRAAAADRRRPRAGGHRSLERRPVRGVGELDELREERQPGFLELGQRDRDQRVTRWRLDVDDTVGGAPPGERAAGLDADGRRRPERHGGRVVLRQPRAREHEHDDVADRLLGQHLD